MLQNSNASLILGLIEIPTLPKVLLFTLALTDFAIKGQALIDFVADFIPPLQEMAMKEIAISEVSAFGGTWTLHTDGASNVCSSGLGVVLKSPQGERIVQAVQCAFEATNNESE